MNELVGRRRDPNDEAPSVLKGMTLHDWNEYGRSLGFALMVYWTMGQRSASVWRFFLSGS